MSCVNASLHIGKVKLSWISGLKNTKKECPFHHGRLECKSRKSRDSWSTGNFGLRVQNEAGQRLRVLPRKRIGDSKHTLPTTQEMTLHMDITRWSIPKPD